MNCARAAAAICFADGGEVQGTRTFAAASSRSALRRSSEARDQHRGSLAPGAAGDDHSVGQGFGVERQTGVHDQVDVGQVDAARGDVGGDQDPRLALPHLVQRAIALGLRALAGDRSRGEPAHDQLAMEGADTLARGAENDRARVGDALNRFTTAAR